MKHVSILVLETAVPQSIADPQYLFTAVNRFLEAEGLPHAFEVHLVALKREVILNEGTITIHADALAKDIKRTGLIIIPALSGQLDAAIKANHEFIPWILAQRAKGAEVASLCVGAFLLASTGLLRGRKCSTHWMFANEFRSRFKDVELVDGGIITEQEGIYTSGGATSYWNLLLYLVEKYAGRATAILAAKFFAIDIERNSQSPFTIFKGQLDHDDQKIKQAQEFIEENFSDRISIEALAEKFSIGRRSLERRFKRATCNTIGEYLQRVKVEAAKRCFETSRKNIAEVMFDVGYTDTKAFRTTFKKITGLTPIEYRNKYNKQVIPASAR